jgi:hypothetical protein
MSLNGFISATFNREIAEQNAYLNLKDKRLPTLIIIEWAGEQEDDNESLTTEPELFHLNEEDDII